MLFRSPLLQGVLGARRDQLHFYLFAFGPLDAAHLIYTTAPGGALPAFDLIHSQRLFGQECTLAWSRGPAFVPELRTPLILLAVSLAFGTVLLTGWVLSLQSFRERAEALVVQRTQTLSESEARYRTVVESLPVPLAVHRDGRVLYVNPATLRLFGATTAADLVGQPILDLIHPDSRSSVQARLESLAATGGATPLTHVRFRRFDGTAVEVEVRSVTIPYEGASAIYTTAEDITARMTTEAALQVSEQRWRYAIEGAGDGLWDWNVPAKTVFFSQRWKEMLGFAEHEVSDRLEEWSDRVHPDDLSRVMAEVQRHLDGATLPYSSEHRCRCKDGSWIWILDRGLVVARDAAGKPVRMIGTHTDITARRSIEDKLRLNEARFHTLFEHSPFAIWDEDFSAVRAYFDQMRAAGVTDFRAHFSAHPDDVVQCARLVKIRAINNQTLRILDAPSKADVMIAVAGYFDATSLSIFREELITLAEGGTFYAGDIPLQLPNGRRIVCAFHLSVVPGAEQTLEQVLFTFEDVTARRRLEQEQRETAMQLSLVIRGGDIGYWDWNFVTGGLVVNNRWLTILGLDPHGTPPSMERWNSLVHPEDVPQFVRQVQEVILNPAGSSGEVEIRARHTAGHYVWILDKFSVVARADDGSPLRVVGTHLDITARKQAEAALRASEARARAIINASPVPMALNDLAGNLTFLNPAFTQTFGYELADIPTLGDWWPQAYPDPAYRQQVAEAWSQEIARSAQTGTALAPCERLIRCKDGTERYVVIGAAILESAFGNEHLAVLHNITERHTAESALLASLAEKTALLKEVHHRVKNNLQVITSLLRLESGRSVVPATKAVLTEMQNRIRAMALLHESLYRTAPLPPWTSVPTSKMLPRSPSACSTPRPVWCVSPWI